MITSLITRVMMTMTTHEISIEIMQFRANNTNIIRSNDKNYAHRCRLVTVDNLARLKPISTEITVSRRSGILFPWIPLAARCPSSLVKSIELLAELRVVIEFGGNQADVVVKSQNLRSLVWVVALSTS